MAYCFHQILYFRQVRICVLDEVVPLHLRCIGSLFFQYAPIGLPSQDRIGSFYIANAQSSRTAQTIGKRHDGCQRRIEHGGGSVVMTENHLD